MKTLRFMLSIIVIAFLICGNRVNAQTVQIELRSSFTDIIAWCMNKSIDGEFVYHFTYHLDTKTGKVDRIHWNCVKSDLRDHITGEKYIAHDIGNDNLGFNWVWWNNVNDNVTNPYNVENGWLPLPDDIPIEGSCVGMNFKFIGKGGEKFTMKFMYQLHINSNNEITVEKISEYADCND